MSFALITGASMGIGEACARDFARQGYNLLLVARSTDKLHLLANELQQRYKVIVHYCIADLQYSDSPQKIYDYCSREHITVDVLLHAAGLSCAGAFEQMPLERLHEIVTVNMNAIAHVTRLFLPDMVQRKRGTIINLASLAGFQGVPGLALYSATKSFVVTFSEALALELQHKGIRVFSVCPGFIATTFFERAGHDSTKVRLPLSSVDVVVKAVNRGMINKQLRVFPTLLDALLVFSQRLVSRATAIRLAGYFAAVFHVEKK